MSQRPVALVTGAARGIGLAIAQSLIAAGYRVMAADLGADQAWNYQLGQSNDIAQALQTDSSLNENAPPFAVCTVDVTNAAACEQAVQKTIETFGQLNLLVNNAGILRDKTFSKLELDNWHAVIDVHLTGSLNATKCVWPIMVEQGYGRIVMTTSTSGLFGNFGQSNYGAAKLGLVGFMNTLRFEGAKYKVYTNAIAPIAATRMTVELPGFEDSAEKLAPELVTPAVVFLCSEKAPNGRIIQAAGGRYYSADVRENVGVNLGLGASVEDIEENIETILDMSSNAGILERTPHR